MRLKLVDYDAMRKAFDEKFKETRQLIEEGETHLDNLAEGFHEADNVIWSMPTIDAVPVVRCRDCNYCTWYTKVNHLMETQSVEYWCTHGTGRSRKVEADHFCSYGERKDGDG